MEAKRRPAQHRLDTAVLTDARDFATLEEEWAELYEDCPSVTPFQSWAWLYSWWEHYGDGYELRLVTVREGGGLLVGVLPLMLERRWGVGRLLPLALGRAPYLDMLARNEWEDRVARAATDVLWDMDGWRVADLQQLRPEAATWALFRNWPGPRTRVWQGYCTLVEAKPWEELLASLSRNHRKTARRALNRAEAEGARWELAELAAAEQAAGRLVDLSRGQWRERWQDTGPEHWTQKFKMHLQTAARRMTSCGLGGISELRRGGETILSTFLLFGRDSVGGYMVATNKEVIQNYSYSSLYIRDMLNIAHDRNIRYIDLFTGEDTYKLRWNPKVVPNHRVILGNDLVYWGPYAGYLVVRFKAVRYALSDDSPEWAREIAHKYVRLRYGVARLRRWLASLGGFE